MRLLILSASAGAGHTRAGQALEEAALLRRPDATVKHVDILDFTAKAYKKAYVGSFLKMVDHAPALWGALYSASDRVKGEGGIRQKFAHFFDKLEFAAFRKFVRDFEPDLVLSTHFLAGQVFGPTRQRGRDRFPFGLVVTDFDVHAFWVQKTADRICVASDELRAILAGKGIEEDRITVTGIPISQAFSKTYDRAAIRGAHGLTGSAPVVLLMGGGAGVGTMEEAARAILAAGPVQLVVVAGRNEELKAQVEKIRPPAGSRLVALGFVTAMGELLAAADLAVTKSGGLTTSECLAMGLPMVVRDPIPGQEERNCDYLLEAGAGVRVNGPDSLRYKVKALLQDPSRLARMAAAARGVSRPAAAQAVLETFGL